MFLFPIWINQWWVINNLLKVTSFFVYVLQRNRNIFFQFLKYLHIEYLLASEWCHGLRDFALFCNRFSAVLALLDAPCILMQMYIKWRSTARPSCLHGCLKPCEGQKNNLRYLRFFLRKKVSNLNGFFFVGVSFSSFSFF